MEVKEFAMCDDCNTLEDIVDSGDECTNCGQGELKPVIVVVCEDRGEHEKAKITVEAALGI